MAKILENAFGRRQIRLSVDDILNIVREYQNNVRNTFSYHDIREKLHKMQLFLPEDL